MWATFAKGSVVLQLRVKFPKVIIGEETTGPHVPSRRACWAKGNVFRFRLRDVGAQGIGGQSDLCFQTYVGIKQEMQPREGVPGDLSPWQDLPVSSRATDAHTRAGLHCRCLLEMRAGGKVAESSEMLARGGEPARAAAPSCSSGSSS